MKRLLVVAAAMATLATACSSGSSGTSTTPTTTAAGTTAAPATTTAPTTTASSTTTTTSRIPDNAVDLTGQTKVTIDVKDDAFVQRVAVVTAGTIVTWTNLGLNAHNVIPSVDGAFVPIPTDKLGSGQSASRTFPSSGDFPYYCSLHGTPRHGMNGRIIVVPAL